MYENKKDKNIIRRFSNPITVLSLPLILFSLIIVLSYCNQEGMAEKQDTLAVNTSNIAINSSFNTYENSTIGIRMDHPAEWTH